MPSLPFRMPKLTLPPQVSRLLSRVLSRRRNVVALATVLGLLAVLGGVALFRGEERTAAAPPPPPPPAPTPAPTTPAPKPPPPLTSPFTGLRVDRLRPVLAIKLDNARPARPHTGLQKADIVYEELVEGGITRFLAVYSADPDTEIGPVRSVRENDLELLRKYGRVAFAYSGANAGVEAATRRAPLLDVSYEEVPSAYRREGSRNAPHNLYASGPRLLGAAPQAQVARDIGLRFGRPPAGAPRGGSLNAVWSPSTRTGFVYDRRAGVYLRSADGRPAMTSGRQMAAATVIVQFVRVRPSRYKDTAGNRSPYTTTTGTGRAVVFRDGVSVAGRWQRRNADTGTRYLDGRGRDIPLKPGQVWILLFPEGRPLQVR